MEYFTPLAEITLCKSRLQALLNIHKKEWDRGKYLSGKKLLLTYLQVADNELFCFNPLIYSYA
jgi:hypothetical protein